MLALSKRETTTWIRVGGAEEDRTPDLLLAKQALSQLSYGPQVGKKSGGLQIGLGFGGSGKS